MSVLKVEKIKLNNNSMTIKKPLSWSQISAFEYNPEQWYKRYILGEKDEGSSALLFGKKIGEQLASDPLFMPEVPRLPVFEYKLQAKISDIELIGYVDAVDIVTGELIEYKSGKKWDKKKAETHGQIDLYATMLYIMHDIRPEDLDIKLIWLATEENGDFQTSFIKDMKPVIFPIKKSMIDIVNMIMRVKRVYKEMESYQQSHLT